VVMIANFEIFEMLTSTRSCSCPSQIPEAPMHGAYVSESVNSAGLLTLGSRELLLPYMTLERSKRPLY
jgi:hypothetical protein